MVKAVINVNTELILFIEAWRGYWYILSIGNNSKVRYGVL